jgi:threonine dehydratase
LKREDHHGEPFDKLRAGSVELLTPKDTISKQPGKKVMLALGDILMARRNLAHLLRKTPLEYSFLLSREVANDVYLKLENWQKTGAFKVRGAVNKMANLSPAEKDRGVVAVSSGNFAVGVAYAARALGSVVSAPRPETLSSSVETLGTRAQPSGGVPVTIFMPTNTPSSKIDKLAEFDVEIILDGATFDEANDISKEFQRERGLTFVHTYDDPLVVAGQGTVGLEIMEQLPEVEAILVPIGGGGLVAGTAVAAKAVNPQVRVIGVQTEASPSAYLSLKEGRCYEKYDAAPTIAEGLAGGFGIVPFTIARGIIDEVILVSEEEIYEAVSFLLQAAQLVVEGSGAVGVAALLSGKVDLKGKKVAVILSGGNMDMEVLSQIMGSRQTFPKA